jgi:hypothetical protein
MLWWTIIFSKRCQQQNKILFVADAGNTALTFWHVNVPLSAHIKSQYTMVLDPVTLSVKQYCVIKFLVNEKVQLARVLHKPSAQYGEGSYHVPVCTTGATNFLKAKKKLLTDHMQMFSWYVTDANIHHTEELILENMWITVCDIVSKMCRILFNGVCLGIRNKRPGKESFKITVLHNNLIVSQHCQPWAGKS